MGYVPEEMTGLGLERGILWPRIHGCATAVFFD